MTEIKFAALSDIDLLYPTMAELRPHRSLEDLRNMLTLQFNEGYKIVYIGDENLAFAIAGFRIITFLFSGKTLYLDDLVTNSAHKKKGYAGQLLECLKKYAKENNCEHISLDSGFQRKDAHRLYLNVGFEVESLHFGRKLSEL